MRTIIGIFTLSIFVAACNPAEQTTSQIIDKVIAHHGGSAYDTLDVEYQFRDKDYALKKDGGIFNYQRIFTDTAGQKTVDILNNEGFKRLVDGAQVELSAKDSVAYANSVNSVHYFALLPYGLKDEAVIAKSMDDIVIKGQEYKAVEVRFKQEGGGTDYEDVFMFWFHAETYAMDYFAYSYHTNNGGVRFRESINKEKVAGVIFQDYNNYKVNVGTDMEELPKLFEKGELDLLSVIDLEF